jgi:hypothetical protein
MSYTVIRGFSDAYGSKHDLHLAAHHAHLAPVHMRDVSAVELDRSGGRFTSLISVRGRLAAADSPTRPSVSPALIERSTPSTAWICPTSCRFVRPGTDREVFDEPFDAKDLLP